MLDEHFNAMLAAARHRSDLLELTSIKQEDREALTGALKTAENKRVGFETRKANLQKAMDLLVGIEFKLDKEAR